MTMLLRRPPRPSPYYLRRFYSTGPGSSQRTVQTPVQSQPADATSPTPAAAPSSSSNKIQTPIQAQHQQNITPGLLRPQQRVNDRYIYITAIVGLLSVPIVSYYYYHYRKDHMDKKWKRMLAEAREKQAGS